MLFDPDMQDALRARESRRMQAKSSLHFSDHDDGDDDYDQQHQLPKRGCSDDPQSPDGKSKVQKGVLVAHEPSQDVDDVESKEQFGDLASPTSFSSKFASAEASPSVLTDVVRVKRVGVDDDDDDDEEDEHHDSITRPRGNLLSLYNITRPVVERRVTDVEREQDNQVQQHVDPESNELVFSNRNRAASALSSLAAATNDCVSQMMDEQANLPGGLVDSTSVAAGNQKPMQVDESEDDDNDELDLPGIY